MSLEKLARRALSCTSAIDVLVAALRKHSAPQNAMSEEERKTALAVSHKLMNCLSLAITHSAAMASRAAISCMQIRRKATLDNCTSVQLSEPVKEWLMLQPFLQDANPTLFGNVVAELQRETSVDMAEFKKGVALLTKPYQYSGQNKSKQTQPRKRSYGQSFDQRSPSQGYNQGNRGRSSGRGSRGSKRGRQPFPAHNTGGSRQESRRH